MCILSKDMDFIAGTVPSADLYETMIMIMRMTMMMMEWRLTDGDGGPPLFLERCEVWWVVSHFPARPAHHAKPSRSSSPQNLVPANPLLCMFSRKNIHH